MRLLLAPALLLGSLAPLSAFAHAGLVSPESRDNNPQSGTSIKTGPCGPNAPGSGPRARFVPGSTVEITFRETINHPGHFILSLSMASDQGFAPVSGLTQNGAAVAADNIPHNAGAPQPSFASPRMYTGLMWTVPNTPCAGCTLQLIQVMTDRNPPTNYYSCADIEIVADTPDAGVAPADAGFAPADTGVVELDAGFPSDAGFVVPADSGVAAADSGVGPAPDSGVASAADSGSASVDSGTGNNGTMSGGCSTSGTSGLGQVATILVLALGLSTLRRR